MSSQILPPPNLESKTEGMQTEGLTVWIPPREAKMLMHLAREKDESLFDAMVRCLRNTFKARR